MPLKRILKFLRNYLFKHPAYTALYGLTFWGNGFTANEHLFTKEEMVQKVREGKSVIRFGDGEINILLDLKNHYESFSKELQKMITEIVESYDKESAYVLSVPRFINTTNAELEKMGKRNVWMPLKTMFALRFPKGVGYMDAHNFYYDNYFENLVQEAGLSNKKVVIVTKQETIDKQKKNDTLPWKEISYVATPESEAIELYDDIQIRVNTELAKYPKKDALVLIAMGPVGKYLAFEYAKMGFQVIDVGKAVEIMFTGESIAYLV